VKDNRLLDGRAVRDRILEQVAERVRAAAATHAIGRLVSISIGEHKEAAVYVRGQARAAQQVGLRFDSETWHATLTQQECKARLVAMNDDPDVLGVILQRPVPTHIHGRSLASAIHPFKDIEGMNPASIGNIVYNELALAPCTAAASVELIKATGLNLHGLEVVMVGHSEIVGKPAAFMLMAEGATVTVCHHMTRSVAAHSRRADAVLVAGGQAEVPARRHGEAGRGRHRHRHQPGDRSERRDDDRRRCRYRRREGRGELGDAGSWRRRAGDRRHVHAQRDRRAREATRRRLAGLGTKNEERRT
jgi:methylenetetrahydrofolate dehydrogenase (NADP+)/methenyltetrahydrofolate cyclohydrolase